MKTSKPKYISASVYTFFFGSLLVLIFVISGLSVHGILLAAIASTLLVPMGIRIIRGRIDIFEPIVLGNLALGVMFVGRPLYDLTLGDTIHLGYDISPAFNEALMVALVGIVFFQLGYFSSIGRGWAKLLPKPPSFNPNEAALAGWFYIIFGGILFTIFLKKFGGLDLMVVLLEGRQQWNNELFLSSTGYLYRSILMWGASSVMFFAIALITKRRLYWWVFLLPTLFLLFYYGARGSRSQLLPIVFAIPVFWYLWKDRRPNFCTLLVAAIIGVSLLGWLREIRTASQNRNFIASLVKSFTQPGKEAMAILGGADAEMFDALADALLVVPEQLSFQHGSTVTDILIRAVPRPLWPNKPLESNDALVVALWPAHYAKSRASPAFSIIGPFYADSGYITVALGMFMCGLVITTLWQWLMLYRMQPIAQLIYSMAFPFIVILLRGTIPDTLSRMLFLVVPLVLFLLWRLLKLRIASRIFGRQPQDLR